MIARGRLWAFRALSVTAALCIFFVMLLTFVDVFLRYVFDKPINGSSEMIAVALALMVFSAFPMVTSEDAHISVSLLKGHLPPVTAWIERLLVLLFNLGTTILICYELLEHANDLARNQQTTPVLALPLWWLNYAMSFLAAVTCIAVLALIADHVRTSPSDPPRPPSPVHEV